jgi:type IV pilus assembly protein PilM
MMIVTRTYTGIDIGSNRVKMVVRSADGIDKIAYADVPAGLVRNGHVTAPETMTEILKELVHKNHIATRDCALVLRGDEVLTRRLRLPLMTEDELLLNLPYEFRDFISDDSTQHLFDYAIIDIIDDAAGKPAEMDLIAVTFPAHTLDAYARMVRGAGFKLANAAPDVIAFENLIQNHEEQHPEDARRTLCCIDIGHDNTAVHLFPHGHYEVTRTIDRGFAALIATLATQFGIDEMTARSYLEHNRDDIWSSAVCEEFCEHIGIEVARIISFFNFNYRDDRLEHAYCCGYGSGFPPLVASIASHTSVDLGDIEQIMPPATFEETDLLRLCAAAVGITL